MSNFTYTTLSDSTLLAKRAFSRMLKQARDAEEDWVNDTTEVFSHYLRDVHGISVPIDFPKQLATANCEFHAYTRNINIPIRVLDSIVQTCSKWLDYLENSKEVFDNLVCHEVLSMVRIHTSVIAGRNIAEVPGVRLKESPPFLMVTIVTMEGAIREIS